MLLAIILVITCRNYLSSLANQNLEGQLPNPFLPSKKVCVCITPNPQGDKREHVLQLHQIAWYWGHPSGPLPGNCYGIETTRHICSPGHFRSWGITGNFYAAVYLSPGVDTVFQLVDCVFACYTNCTNHCKYLKKFPYSAISLSIPFSSLSFFYED